MICKRKLIFSFVMFITLIGLNAKTSYANPSIVELENQKNKIEISINKNNQSVNKLNEKVKNLLQSLEQGAYSNDKVEANLNIVDKEINSIKNKNNTFTDKYKIINHMQLNFNVVLNLEEKIDLIKKIMKREENLIKNKE